MPEHATQLEAGPELDARVAEILDWRRLETSWAGPTWMPPGTSLDGAEVTMTQDNIPEFSVSHEAAARIKHRLRDQLRIDIQYRKDIVRAGTADWKIMETAESEPLALCRFLVRLDNEGVLDDATDD